jgi:hypothetical protein
MSSSRADQSLDQAELPRRGVNRRWGKSILGGSPDGSQTRTRSVAIRNRDESGSSLVLALVFLVATGLIVTALAGWTGNDLRNSVSFKSQRSELYAANATTNVAIWTTRYSYSTGPGVVACPGAPPAQPAQPTNGLYIEDLCNTTPSPGSPATRVVTISACLLTPSQAMSGLVPSTSAPSQDQFCTNANSTSKLVLQAVVTFDDYSVSDEFACSSPTITSTCGTGMTVNSWVDK